jgi:hypothetical protein
MQKNLHGHRETKQVLQRCLRQKSQQNKITNSFSFPTRKLFVAIFGLIAPLVFRKSGCLSFGGILQNFIRAILEKSVQGVTNANQSLADVFLCSFVGSSLHC